MKPGVLCAVLLWCAVASGQPLEELRAVKLTNVDSRVLFSGENIAEAMDYLSSIGVNAVFPVVWNGGWTLYQSPMMKELFGTPIHPRFAGWDPLERVVLEAHRVGIEVYPWVEYGDAAWYSGDNPAPGGHLLNRFPQWASRTIDGRVARKDGFDWLSAINPDVQMFFEKMIAEVITRYDVNGIEFSDRIPAMPVEGGYDSATVALYKEEHAGAAPPRDCKDPAWMQWRADKMSAWCARVRTMVKRKNPDIIVASSPLTQPEAYNDYLLDTKRWVRDGIIDHFIPQLYVRSFEEYRNQLHRALHNVDTIQRHKFFAGILMNIGTGANEYVIDPGYLLHAIAENRAAGVNGEAFFYYEGLRKHNNRLGDTLGATVYRRPALVPGRGGRKWRPQALIVDGDDADATKIGTWAPASTKGFRNRRIVAAADGKPKSVEYHARIETPGYYDVYAYHVPERNAATRVTYITYSDSTTIQNVIDQSDTLNKGWQKLGTVYLSKGNKRVVRLELMGVESGRLVYADAIMVMLNRMRSHQTSPRTLRLRSASE